MPKMTNCNLNGKSVTVNEALRLRDDARSGKIANPNFVCDECHQPVRPHKTGGHASAHFEHLERNPQCSQSDVARK
jgi:hypothetical protein